MNLSKDALVDKVIAFNLDGDVSFGYVFSTEGKEIRVFEYKPISTTPAQSQRVLDKVVEEDALITSLQAQLKALRDRYDVESSESKSGEGYKMESMLLQWSHERLCSLPAAGWVELAKAPDHWRSALLVCEAVVLMTENNISHRGVPPNKVRSLFSKSDLVETLRGLADKPLRESVYQKILDEYLANRLFSLEEVAAESKHAAALYKWVNAFIDYQRARFIKGGDKELQIQIDNCVKGIGQSSRRKSLLLEEQELVKNQKVRRRTGHVHVVPIEDFLYVVEGDPSAGNTLTVNDHGVLRPLLTIASSATQTPRSKDTPRERNEDAFLPKRQFSLDATAVVVAAASAAASAAVAGGASTPAPPTLPRLPLAPRHAALSKCEPKEAKGPILTRAKGAAAPQAEKQQEATREEESKSAASRAAKSKEATRGAETKNGAAAFSPAFLLAPPCVSTSHDVEATRATTSEDADGASLSGHTSETAAAGALRCHHDAWAYQLSDLRHQLELVESSQSKLIREHETLRSRYENVVDAFYLLLEDEESDRGEVAALRRSFSQSRQELLLCKALVKLLRRENAAASGQAAPSSVPFSSTHNGAGRDSKKNNSSQLLLDETAEYLQGVLASLAVNLS